MDKEQSKASNEKVLDSLQEIKKGSSGNAKEMIFDPATGEFFVPGPERQTAPDGITINSIAEDGFAK